MDEAASRAMQTYKNVRFTTAYSCQAFLWAEISLNLVEVGFNPECLLQHKLLPITSTVTLPLAFPQNIAHDHVKPTVRTSLLVAAEKVD